MAKPKSLFVKPFFAQSRGFTLLELLLTLLVIGLGVGLASLSLSGTRSHEIKNAARQLQAQMQLASEEAILKNQQLGLIFDVELGDSDSQFSFPQYSYRWLLLASVDDPRLKGRKIYYWQEVEDNLLLASADLPEAIELNIKLEGQAIILGDNGEDESRLKLLTTELSEEDKIDDEGKPINQIDTKLRPDLFFFSSGEILAFEMQLYDAALELELGAALEKTQTYRFKGNMIGQIDLLQAGEEEDLDDDN